MKRFSPCTAYKINGKIRYSFIAPDGEKKVSTDWKKDRIKEIRSIFLHQNSSHQYQLKKYQRQIMHSILSGNDTFVILPTGSGKSLCFQAPSVFFPGITLVITPLVALIENQVDNFNRNSYPLYHPNAANYYQNIRFKAIYPGMDGLSSRALFSEIQNPRENRGGGRQVQYKFLYVSPERLCSPKFLRDLSSAERSGLRIDHIVIDEVHCMSQWGFEFRESYLHIADFIRQRPMRPVISAFTATATPKDIAEIKNILHFPTDKREYEKKKYYQISHVARRGNLSLHVIPCSDYEMAGETDHENKRRLLLKDDIAGEGKSSAPSKGCAENNDPQDSTLQTRKDTLIHILEKNLTKVCIIYRTTASGVDELYQELKNIEKFKGRLVKYHAGMSGRAKARSKNCFLSSRDENLNGPADPNDPSKTYKNIMIATKAFGMGIDKRDISLIIHYDMPRSLEDYYQEAGRAGRDPVKVPLADCFLLYSAGPKKEKGTLQYTINWVTSEKGSLRSDCMPISSQFSDDMKENIYFWSYYRLCYVRKYCNIMKYNPDSDAAHNFIIRYLRSSFTLRQCVRDLDDFYSYITDHYPVTASCRDSFIDRCLFSGSSAVRFLGPGFGQTGNSADSPGNDRISCSQAYPESDRFHDEIRKLMGEVNELHINNTYAANLLRHHPDRYQLNSPYVLSEDSPDAGQEWKSKKNKKVKGAPSGTLRRSDFSQDAGFIFVEDPKSCEEYVNASWDSRRDRRNRASIIFTVNRQCIINGVLKMQGDRWTPVTGREHLLPYERYLGCDVKGLFPRERFGPWRRIQKNSLFAYTAGAENHELRFTVYGSEKPSYFDMCVLDAVYSIKISGKKTIYVQTIWEILTGRNTEYSSREKLDFRERIQNSIDRMRAMRISISDNQCGLEIEREAFLPLSDTPKGQKGYTCPAIPPLFLYAEEMNGQIIRVPVSFFNTARIEKTAFWKNDFYAEFTRAGLDQYSFGGIRKYTFDTYIKSLSQSIKFESDTAELLSPGDIRRLENIRSHTCSFRPSTANALLCHYLIHRTAISKARKRGNFILFSTVKSILGLREETCLFHKKTAAFMNRLLNIGYLDHFYFYVKDYDYHLTDGTCVTDNAYFKVEAVDTIKYWRLHGTGHLLLSDFTVTWSLQYHEQLLDDNSNFEMKTKLSDAIDGNNCSLSARTKRELAAMPIGRMDGIVLRHN